MKRSQDRLVRYSPLDRANHWTMVIAFVLLALSGLAFFHPAFFFLSHSLGGPVWARILHPFLGLVLVLLFVAMAVRHVSRNLLGENDVQWMRQIGDVLDNRDDKLPPIGKYNPGQKLVFWALVVSIAALLVSGVIMWRPWFAGYFPIPLIRLASLVHALAAFVAIVTIVVHVYAALWVKGSIRSMTQGWVTRAWARHHHGLWAREQEEKQRREPQP